MNYARGQLYTSISNLVEHLPTLCLFGLFIYAYITFLLPDRFNTYDFDNFYSSSWFLRNGLIPYCAELAGREIPGALVISEGLKATNAPGSLFLALPFTWLPLKTAWLLWTLITIGIIFGIVTELLKLLHFQLTFSIRILITSVLLLTFPFFYSLYTGQLQPLIFYLCLVGTRFFLNDKKTAAGVLWGTAIVLKPIPAYIVLWLVIRKDWRTVGAISWSAASLLLLSAIPYGASLYVDFLRCGTQGIEYWMYSGTRNISFQMIITRLGVVFGNPMWWPMAPQFYLLKLFSPLLCGVIVWYFRTEFIEGQRGTLACLAGVFTASFFSFGVAWPSYLVVELLPLSLLVIFPVQSLITRIASIIVSALVVALPIVYEPFLGSYSVWALKSLLVPFAILLSVFSLKSLRAPVPTKLIQHT